MRARTLGTLAGLALVLVASPSSAAPDRTVTLSASSRTASWQSALGVATFGFSPLLYEQTHCAKRGGDVVTCDQTAMRVMSAGSLEITIAPEGSPNSGPIYAHTVELHRVGPDGQPGGPVKLRSSRAGSKNIYASGVVPAGSYLLEVSWLEGVGKYSGDAELKPVRPR